MEKHTSAKQINRQKDRRFTPTVVYIWLFAIGFLGYFIGRTAFGAFPHPVHWLAALIGAVLGYFIGWLWYFLRGDIS